MTSPIDITDARTVKAIAHPLRLQILAVLNDRVASPSEVADELGTPLSNTSYHVRQLAELGFLRLVHQAARRGAIEHYYTATVRPVVSADTWARVPPILRQAMVSRALGQDLSAVTGEGSDGSSQDDVRYSRASGRLDEAGRQAVATELAALDERLGVIFAASEARLLDSPEPAQHATVMVLQVGTAHGSGHLLEVETDASERPASP